MDLTVGLEHLAQLHGPRVGERRLCASPEALNVLNDAAVFEFDDLVRELRQRQRPKQRSHASPCHEHSRDTQPHHQSNSRRKQCRWAPSPRSDEAKRRTGAPDTKTACSNGKHMRARHGRSNRNRRRCLRRGVLGKRHVSCERFFSTAVYSLRSRRRDRELGRASAPP